MYDLSRRIVDDGGFVCGCVWNIDMKAHHIVSNKARDLRRMQSSKYVQSDTELCFAAIKKLFKEGKEVMFCGTQCQTAGLHHFLGKSDISKLISVCLICHGVPSPLVWEKYKKAIEVKYKGHLVGVNMRDKSKEGYSTSYCKYTFTSLSKNECREEIGHSSPILMCFYLQTIFIFGIAVRTVLINQTIAKLILLLVIFTLLLKAQVMGDVLV